MPPPPAKGKGNVRARGAMEKKHGRKGKTMIFYHETIFSGSGFHREFPMSSEVKYNEIISFDRDGMHTHRVAKSYAEEGKLILVLETSEKIVIPGRKLDTTGHKKRIQELVAAAGENGCTVDPLAVKHYASAKSESASVEYILLKW